MVAICAAVLVCFSFPVETFAQDAETIELSQIDPSTNETTRMILRSVRDANPQTGPELAKVAEIMMDIERYNDAKFYLSKIAELGLDDNQLFELNESVGSDFFSLIQIDPFVQPQGKSLARQVLIAARKVSISPERIGQLIKSLNQNDDSVRSESFRKLRRLGEPAVAELLNVFADAERIPEYPVVRGALKNMGPDAQGPLLGAARASDLQVQTEAVRALGHYDTSESLDVMMRTYVSPKLPDFLRRIALESLTEGHYPADPARIEQRLYQRSMEYLMGERQVAGALMGTVKIWNWDQESKRMVSTDVVPATASRVIASRRAADLYEMNPALARNREMYLLTQLEAAKRVVGASRKTDTAALIKQLDAKPEEIDGILEQALKMELVPAAIACCELLEEFGNSELLTASAGQPRPLIKAVLFGDRHLQFAAMQAIAVIDPQRAYAGSSYMIALAVYLAQSENRPAGLIGHLREDIAQSYAAALGASGLSGQAVSSSREFFRAATSNPDISVLLVTDTLDKPVYAELIQQLRKDWRTRRTPIALLYNDVQRSQRVERRLGNDPRFSSIPFSLDPDLVATHVQRLNDLVKPWSVTNLDRRRHAAAAVRWLTKVAGDRERYGFYNLGTYQTQLARLLYLPGFASSASQILESLGTPTAQRELVNFASQAGLPADEREEVVEAFVRSVNNGGTLLTTREILQQYDRYNASESEPAATQKVLGSILDAIEARKRKSSN